MSKEQVLLDFLARNKRNITQQRLDIAKRFLSMKGHHTLEDIYLAIRETSPKVGQSTVYRTIHLLRDAGLAREVLSSWRTAVCAMKWLRGEGITTTCSVSNVVRWWNF